MPKIEFVTKTEYDESREFVNAVEVQGFNENPDQHKFKGKVEKIDLLRQRGHRVLYGSGETDLDLEECSIPRLTLAVVNEYNSAKKKVEVYEQQIRAGEQYKNIVALLETEEALSDCGDEGTLESAVERTAIVLDSAAEDVLRMLSQVYSPQVLGGYFRQN